MVVGRRCRGLLLPRSGIGRGRVGVPTRPRRPRSPVTAPSSSEGRCLPSVHQASRPPEARCERGARAGSRVVRGAGRRSGRLGPGRSWGGWQRQGAQFGLAHPTEERIARMVSEGATNQETASALFLSIKTVSGTCPGPTGSRDPPVRARRWLGSTMPPLTAADQRRLAAWGTLTMAWRSGLGTLDGDLAAQTQMFGEVDNAHPVTPIGPSIPCLANSSHVEAWPPGGGRVTGRATGQNTCQGLVRFSTTDSNASAPRRRAAPSSQAIAHSRRPGTMRTLAVRCPDGGPARMMIGRATRSRPSLRSWRRSAEPGRARDRG